MKNENGFPSLLERFFTQRLIAQRRVSPHTIASYRDTFRLLLQFVEKRLRKPPSGLALTDLDPFLIGAFLDGLEKDRGNGARSRNLRLTAVRSFHRYAAHEEPAQSGLIQRVLAMPAKRYEKKLVGFLTRPEIEALLAAPDLNTWAGRRDRTFLLVAVQTGLRLSEMTSLRIEDGFGNWRACALYGQRAERAMHPIDEAGRRHRQTVAAGSPAWHRRHCVSERAGNQTQRRWGAVSVGQACHDRPTKVPFAEEQTGDAPCPSPLSTLPDYVESEKGVCGFGSRFQVAQCSGFGYCET